MAFQAHNLHEAIEDIERDFTTEELAAAAPVVDALRMRILEVLLQSTASTMKFHDKEQKRIEAAMGGIGKGAHDSRTT